MPFFSEQKMYCTICGKEYQWSVKYSWPQSRACSKECHHEWRWRETLSIMGKEYTPYDGQPSKVFQVIDNE